MILQGFLILSFGIHNIQTLSIAKKNIVDECKLVTSSQSVKGQIRKPELLWIFVNKFDIWEASLNTVPYMLRSNV